MNIATVLAMADDGGGERIAVSDPTGRLSYRELRLGAARAATEFAALGPRTVVSLCGNEPATPIALFGALWAGCRFVPLNHRLPAATLRRQLEILGRATVVADAATAADLGVDGPVVDPARLRALECAEADLADVDGDDPAVVLFTSGTSGDPKTAVLRHRNLVSYVMGSVDFASASPEETGLLSVPPFHIAGVSSMLTSTFAGRRLELLGRFDAAGWIEAVGRAAVTHAFVVPTMLARIVELLDPDDARLGSLRTLSYGGSRMPLPVIEAALRLFPGHVDFVNAYGLTETSSTVLVLGPEDHREALSSADEDVRRRLRSVGRPLPGVEATVRDVDGTAVAPGRHGELWLRGAQVSGEYNVGSRIDAEGWFHTGDEAWTDAEGYFFIEGRLDDVIIRGGENIAAREIEDTLLDHPAVRSAAVVGLPDTQWGERVGAMVVLAEEVSSDALLQWTRERIGRFKTPEALAVVAELPVTATGKVIARQVRDGLLARDEAPEGVAR